MYLTEIDKKLENMKTRLVNDKFKRLQEKTLAAEMSIIDMGIIKGKDDSEDVVLKEVLDILVDVDILLKKVKDEA
jgi:hypothetical protein